MVSPVALPPGRARLDAMPLPTGSPVLQITMGIVVVDFLAASGATVPVANMTSTLRLANSAAKAGSRSRWLSAYRRSTIKFRPST